MYTFASSTTHTSELGKRVLLKICTVYEGRNLKVQKHEFFFFTFFAETETIWSQGPVTRDF